MGAFRLRTKIIEGIKHNIETTKPSDIKLGILDILVYGGNLDGRIEGMRSPCSDLV